MRKFIAVVIAGMVMALGLATPSVSAAKAPSATKTGMVATSTFNACAVPLNADRRTVYRFTRGGNTLSFGQVVVTATRDYYHRYCVQYQTGGRNLWTSWSIADAPYGGGCGSFIGRMGDSGYWSTGFNSTVTVPDKTCVKKTYGIKSGGVWWYASFMRYNA